MTFHTITFTSGDLTDTKHDELISLGTDLAKDKFTLCDCEEDNVTVTAYHNITEFGSRTSAVVTLVVRWDDTTGCGCCCTPSTPSSPFSEDEVKRTAEDIRSFWEEYLTKTVFAKL